MSDINDNYAMNGLPENPIDELIEEINHLKEKLKATEDRLEEANISLGQIDSFITMKPQSFEEDLDYVLRIVRQYLSKYKEGKV